MIRLFTPSRWLDPAMKPFTVNLERALNDLETLPEFTADKLPDAASHRGKLIAYTTAGYAPAYSDGAVWRRLADNSVI